MILVDTSVWVDHLRTGNQTLRGLLERELVLVHPFVIGEMALGDIRHRARVLHELSRLQQALVATDGEVMRLIENHALFGTGIGYVDAHLLASTGLTPETELWTHDKKLAGLATRMGLPHHR